MVEGGLKQYPWNRACNIQTTQTYSLLYSQPRIPDINSIEGFIRSPLLQIFLSFHQIRPCFGAQANQFFSYN